MARSTRHRSREFVLQALYQWQYTGHSFAELNLQYSVAEEFPKANPELFRTILKGVIDNGPDLIEAIQPHLDRPWIEVSPVERGVMLVGAYEMAHMLETPYRVIINEAIELAKSYGGTDGHKYVNGVLDKLAALVRASEIEYQAANPGSQATHTSAGKSRSKAAVTVTTKPTRKTSEAPE